MSNSRPIACFLEPASFSDWSLTEANRLYRVTTNPAEAEIVFVRVGQRIDAPFLERMPGLRVVVSPTTGVDHIDLDACAERTVEVLTLRSETTFLENLPNTAEHAFALLLALYRRLLPACRSVSNGQWSQAEFRGNTLAGKKFAIVGYGRLGKIAANIALGFGMRVSAYDPNATIDRSIVNSKKSLHDLAESADVLSLHASLNQDSHGMIDGRVLERMPNHAVIINTARGQLIDESALLKALEAGRLAGAALDVLCGETELNEHNPLINYARSHDNLIITPHIGGQTQEAVERADKFIFTKLAKWYDASKP